MPFQPGNRLGGRKPKRTRDMEEALYAQEKERIPQIVAALGDMALSGDTDAARIYLDRLLGKVRVRPDDRPVVPVQALSAEDVATETVSLIGAQVRSLAAVARSRALSAEELSALAGFGRVLMVATRDERASAESKVAAMSDDELARLAQELASKP